MELEIVKYMLEDERFDSLFEVGCAEGGLLADACARRDVRVGGFDINEQSLEKARERFPKYKDNFVRLNVEGHRWPIQDKAYDVAFTAGTLMYVCNPLPAIHEMLRIAKKVIIAEPHDSYAGELGRFIGKDHHGVRIVRDYVGLLGSFAGLGVKGILLKPYKDKLVIKVSL